jgi:hypothetical protein
VGANLEVPGVTREQLSDLFRDEHYAANGQDIAVETLEIPAPTTSLDPAP